MTSRVQRAIAAGLFAGLLGLVAACSTTDGATPAATTTSSVSTSTAAPTSPAAGNFCADLKSFWDMEAKAFADAMAGNKPSAPDIAAALRLQVTKINASAPAEIRNDWVTVSPVFEDLAKQLEAPSAAFPGKIAAYQQNQAFVAAALRVFDYAKKTCALDVSDMLGTK